MQSGGIMARAPIRGDVVGTEAILPGASLDAEIRLYRERLAELLGPDGENEGRYVLIRGSEVRGPFSDRGEALAEGYTLYGTGAFLVKKIERVERLLHFPRGPS
jgi:hypothetical protein